MSELHPNSWKCPNCGAIHSKPHWQDYHQEQPGWKDKLDPHGNDKGSDPAYEYVCETCGGKLEPKNGIQWCKKCNEPKEGIPASLFCPHCGYTVERIVLVKI